MAGSAGAARPAGVFATSCARRAAAPTGSVRITRLRSAPVEERLRVDAAEPDLEHAEQPIHHVAATPHVGTAAALEHDGQAGVRHLDRSALGTTRIELTGLIARLTRLVESRTEALEEGRIETARVVSGAAGRDHLTQ